MTDSTGAGHVSVTRRIDAPAARIFAVLRDPSRHPAIDGSGMVRDGTASRRISAVGQVFRMQMHHVEWGDYQMDNHVTAFEPERRIAWEPQPVPTPDDADDKVPADYVWAYDLEPHGDATVVTESFDCSRSPRWLREATSDGTGWVQAMTETLERLDRLCAAEPGD